MSREFFPSERDHDGKVEFERTSVLDVGELVRGQQQIPRLLHAEAVVLEHLAREDDVLCRDESTEKRVR